MSKLENFLNSHNNFLNEQPKKKPFAFFRSKKYFYFDSKAKDWKDIELGLIGRIVRFIGFKYKETRPSSFKEKFIKQAKQIKSDKAAAVAKLTKKLFRVELDQSSDAHSQINPIVSNKKTPEPSIAGNNPKEIVHNASNHPDKEEVKVIKLPSSPSDQTLNLEDSDTRKLVEDCPHIEFLEVKGPQSITAESLVSISQLQKLETLQFQGSHLNSEDFQSLNSPALKNLLIEEDPNMTHAGFLSNMPQLEQVSLSGCDQFNDPKSFDNFQGKSVNFAGCSSLDVEELKSTQFIFINNDADIAGSLEGEITDYAIEWRSKKDVIGVFDKFARKSNSSPFRLESDGQDVNRYLDRLLSSDELKEIKCLNLQLENRDNIDQKRLVKLITSCESLESLIIKSDFELSKDLLRSLNSLQNLKALSLDGHVANQKSFTKLQLEKLETLYVNGTVDNLSFIKHLKKFPALKSLYMGGIGTMTNNTMDLSALEGLTNIQTLRLPLFVECFTGSLPLLPSLKNLEISGWNPDSTEVFEERLKNYKGSSLQYLKLPTWSTFPFEKLDKFINENPIQTLKAEKSDVLIGKEFTKSSLVVKGVPSKITQFKFSLGELFKGKSPKQVADIIIQSDEKESFVHADFTGFTEPFDLDEETLLNLFKHCPNISYLALDDASAMTKNCLSALNRLENLHTLRLSQSQLNSEEFDELNNKHLKHLYLSQCNLLENIDFVKTIPSIEEVSLEGCQELKSLDALQSIKIESLTIKDCPNVSDEKIQKAMEKVEKRHKSSHDRILKDEVEFINKFRFMPRPSNLGFKKYLNKFLNSEYSKDLVNLTFDTHYNEGCEEEDLVQLLNACKNVESLELTTDFALSKKTLEAIGNLKKLKKLTFASVGHIKAEDFEAIQLNQLEEFCVKQDCEDLSFLRHLRNFPNLKKLDMSYFVGTKTENVVDLLKNLTQIKSLALYPHGLKIKGPLPFLNQLEEIIVNGHLYKDVEMKALFKNYSKASLKHLDISNSKSFSFDSLQEVLSKNPSIETLTAYRCPQLIGETFDTDIQVEGVPSKITQDDRPLEDLFKNKSPRDVIEYIVGSPDKDKFIHADFRGFPEPIDLDEEALLKLFNNCPNIEFIALDDAQMLSTKSLAALSQLQRLRSLSLQNSSLNAEDMKSLKNQFISDLELIEFKNLTDIEFTRGTPYLSSLTLKECPDLRNIEPLKNHAFSFLSVKRCPGIPSQEIQSIADSAEELYLDKEEKRFKMRFEHDRILKREVEAFNEGSPIGFFSYGEMNPRKILVQLAKSDAAENLKNLNLSSTWGDTSFDESDIIKVLNHCKNIERIEFSPDLTISDRLLKEILKLENLKSINLSSKALGEEGLVKILKTCNNLEQIKLTGYSNLSSKTIGALEGLKNLKVLRLHSSNLKEEHFSKLSLPSLEELSVSGFVEDTSFLKHSKKLPKLKHLDLSYLITNNIQNASDLLKGFDRLETLALGHSNLKFESPLPYIPSLKQLFLNGLIVSIDDSIDLFENYTNSYLEELDISGVESISARSIKDLIKNNSLKKLLAYICPQLDENIIEKKGLEVRK